ncbi:MAG: serine protease [Candidatus Coatesbacteria bacterium]
MALLPPEFLNAVVAIEQKVEDASLREPAYVVLGTGFMVIFPTEPEVAGRTVSGRVYLVTARHVLLAALQSGRRVVHLRFNRGSLRNPLEMAIQDAAGNNLWLESKDRNADIVLIPVNTRVLERAGVHVERIGPHKMAEVRGPPRTPVAEGDAVFVVGFPAFIQGISTKRVIVRSGTISCLDSDMIDGAGGFLIESFSFGGSSGAPVFVRPTMESVGETEAITDCILLGIVTQKFQYQEYAPVVGGGKTPTFQPVAPVPLTGENSGISLVVPADFIKEIAERDIGKKCW